MPDVTCPPEDTLRELLEGTLDSTAATTVDEHVSGCPACERRLAAIQPPAGVVVWQGWLDAPPDGGLTRVIELTPGTPAGVRRFGKYQIEGELGRGGMGVVYRALDTRLNRPVALKVMLQSATASPAARERFVQEARSAAAIRSEHVVTTYEADEIAGTSYIAFELLEGRSLAAALAADPQPPVAEVVRVISHVARGLDAAHRLGFVHRDIKPSNLWVCEPTGPVKVLDFGLTRPPRAADGLTGAGAVLGTPGYLAPEQARGEPTDARADLFSLGVTAYQMLTGKMPFPGETAAAMLMALADSNPLPVRDHRPDCPAPLAALVHSLLSKDPAGRPPTAAEVAHQLDAMSRRLDLMRPTTRARRRKWPAIAAGVGLVLAAVIATALLWPAPPSASPTSQAETPPAAAKPTAPSLRNRSIALKGATEEQYLAWVNGLPADMMPTRLSRRGGTSERVYDAVAHDNPGRCRSVAWPFRTFAEQEKLGFPEGYRLCLYPLDPKGGTRVFVRDFLGPAAWGANKEGIKLLAVESQHDQNCFPTSFTGDRGMFDLELVGRAAYGRSWSLIQQAPITDIGSYFQAVRAVGARPDFITSVNDPNMLGINAILVRQAPPADWTAHTDLTPEELTELEEKYSLSDYRLDNLCSHVTPKGVRYIATWLRLASVPEATDESTRAMNELRQNSVRFQYVQDGEAVIDSTPRAIPAGRLDLHHVQLIRLPRLTPRMVDLFCQMPHISRSLEIQQTPLTTNQAVRLLTATCCRGMCRVLLTFCQLSDDALVPFADLLTLDEVSLAGNQLRGSGLKHLIPLRLFSLNLTQCQQLETESATFLAKMPTLRELSLAYTPVGEESLPKLAFLKSLRWLSLGGPKAPLTDALFETAGKEWPKLRRLELANARVTPAGIAALKGCADFHSLTLQTGSVVRADGVRAMSQLTKLQHLQLLFLGDVVDDTVAEALGDALGGLTELKSLEIRQHKLSPAAITRLGERLKCKVVIDNQEVSPKNAPK